MKKIAKILLSGCLLCFSMAIAATAVGCADEELTPMPTEPTTVDTAKKDLGYAPDITVDWEEYSSENIPQAVKDAPYHIFTASAEDVYGEELTVKTRVYLHYSEATKALIEIDNSSITPKYYGIYTVEYTATDLYGNKSVETYDFWCKETETLKLALSGGDKTALAGKETEIASYSYSNAIGKADTKIKATHKQLDVAYDLTGKTSFVPMYAGEYTIEYVCKDYNLQETESYSLIVDKHEEPIFFEEADLPKYFIVGEEYTLPNVKAYHFATEKPVAIQPTITLQCDTDKAVQLNESRKFVVEKEGQLSFTYSISYGENKQERNYTAYAVDVGKYSDGFDISQYFYTSNAFVEATSDCVSVSTETENAEVEFINTLSSRGFEFAFALTESCVNFDVLEMYLIDSKDSSISLKLTYGNIDGQKGYFTVNDGKRYEANGFLFTNAQSIVYDEKNLSVDFGMNVSVSLEKIFKGFPSGKICFSFVFGGVKGRTQIDLYSIDNQILYDVEGDMFEPKVWMPEYTKGVHKLNDLITIDPVQACDVLDSNFTVECAVLTPNGVPVIDENGQKLTAENMQYTQSYTFRAREYGEYRIVINAYDTAGNSQTYSYVVVVGDFEAAKVTLETAMPTSLKVGESFTVSNISIVDNVYTEFQVHTYLFTPTMKEQTVEIGKSYKLTEAGKYIIYYSVVDGAGNVTLLCHIINVI